MKLLQNTFLPTGIALMITLQTFAGAPVKHHVSTASKHKSAAYSIKNVEGEILTGAVQTEKYLPLLQGKRVGMVVNPTSIIGKTTVVDSLIKQGINIVKIFGPEHGFRGDASAGIKVNDAVDEKTGIKVISLYGKHEVPGVADLSDIDVMVFDIQDVGVRFYTYINTLQHVMQACAENKKELLILDRPNPNGFYVDGPILDPKLVSGLGLQPIPIVHGLTVGEYAQMLNGEGWLTNKVKCEIKIIKVANYNHDMPYELPVKPSPNLNTQQSILLYPTLCLFEGTYLSQGRGTLYPFTVLGAPALKGKYDFSFTPKSIKGMAETPLHQEEECYGLDLRNKHVKVDGNTLRLKFIGKKGVKQEVALNDKSLAAMVKKCMEIPGQDLFQYYTEGKEHKGVDSGKINNYIREITGSDFTAKDFRTWGGTLEALRQLAICTCNIEEVHPKKKVIVQVLDCVASKLGNTRAVCKSSYVYPLLLEAFENDQLAKYLKKIHTEKPNSQEAIENDEKVLMKFLKEAQKLKKN